MCHNGNIPAKEPNMRDIFGCVALWIVVIAGLSAVVAIGNASFPNSQACNERISLTHDTDVP
jgi:hypothetical protein